MRRIEIEDATMKITNGGLLVYDKFLEIPEKNLHDDSAILTQTVRWQDIMQQSSSMEMELKDDVWTHSGIGFPKGNCFDFVAQVLNIDISKDYHAVLDWTFKIAGVTAKDVKLAYVRNIPALRKWGEEHRAYFDTLKNIKS